MDTSNETVIVLCIVITIAVIVIALCVILLMICFRHNGKQNNIDYYFECYLNVTLIGNCLFIYLLFCRSLCRSIEYVAAVSIRSIRVNIIS